MKKVLKAIALCSIILTLSACGSKTASIDGTWYSSKGSAQLVFDDGAFSSPDLSYLPGEATLEGDVISIADNLGDTTELYLFDKDIITTKQYTEKDFEWAFFRSREAADQYAADYEAAAEERAAKEEQAKQEQLKAEAGDIMEVLTAGTWKRPVYRTILDTEDNIITVKFEEVNSDTLCYNVYRDDVGIESTYQSANITDITTKTIQCEKGGVVADAEATTITFVEPSAADDTAQITFSRQVQFTLFEFESNSYIVLGDRDEVSLNHSNSKPCDAYSLSKD